MITYLNDALERVGLSFAEYGATITFFGFRGVKIEGHDGLTEYDEERVCVKIKKKILTVVGCKLIVREITKDELFLSGIIRGMDVQNAR